MCSFVGNQLHKLWSYVQPKDRNQYLKTQGKAFAVTAATAIASPAIAAGFAALGVVYTAVVLYSLKTPKAPVNRFLDHNPPSQNPSFDDAEQENGSDYNIIEYNSPIFQEEPVILNQKIGLQKIPINKRDLNYEDNND